MQGVEAYYDSRSEEEWSRLDRHRTEYAVTKRALAEFLPSPPVAIADVGGGPGRYAIHLAGQGYHVTLVDLSEQNLALAQQKAAEHRVRVHRYLRADAVSLDQMDSESMDAVLLLGPLYHLPDEADRAQAVAEALRILKPDGVLFASFITRFAPFRGSAAGYPEWYLENPQIAWKILTSGVHDQPVRFTHAYFAHPEEVLPFIANFPLRSLALIGCEGVVSGHEEKLNELEGEAWERWAELNYRLGQDRALHGASDHLLYVGAKSA